MKIINTQESEYSLLVTIKSELIEDLELKDIPCNFVLPKEITGEITLQFFLTKEQYKQSGIEEVWNFSASGERKEVSMTYQKIVADKILFSTDEIHDDLFVITGKPRTLYLENHWSFVHEVRKPIVEFQITPSKLLKPIRSMPDKDKYLWQTSIKLCDGNTIVFDDNEYKYQDGKGNLITANSLVARCESLENGNQEDVQRPN